jgi:hypothetical protein
MTEYAPKRLSQTDTGKHAGKWSKVLAYYPALDSLIDVLYDEGTDEQGRRITSDNPERLEKVHKQLEQIRGKLTSYANNKDEAVQYWAKEVLKFLEGEITEAYNVKHKYLTKKFENMKARIAEQKTAYEEGIAEGLPETEKEIDDNLGTLKRIEKFSGKS